MHLTILGSGTMVPTSDRAPSSYLLEYKGTRMLLDCGHLTLARMLKYGISIQSIDAVAITHFHTDHISHLLPLIHARAVDDFFVGRENKPLALLGPESLEARYEKLREVSWPESQQQYPLTFHEGIQECSIGPFHVQPFPVAHVPYFQSIGYRIECEGASLVYTGDLGPEQGEELEHALQGVDLLLIEAGVDEPSKSHCTAQQALSLAERCRVKRVLLTHIHTTRLQNVRSFVTKHQDRMAIAEDGMKVEV